MWLCKRVRQNFLYCPGVAESRKYSVPLRLRVSVCEASEELRKQRHRDTEPRRFGGSNLSLLRRRGCLDRAHGSTPKIGKVNGAVRPDRKT